MYELALSQSEQDSQLPILNLFEFCLDIGEHFRYRRKKSRINDKLTLNRLAKSLCVPSLFCHALNIFCRKSSEYAAIFK